MKQKPPFLEVRPFATSLADAVHYCLLSRDLPETDPMMLRYTHSSILHAALSLEGLANILLQRTSAPKRLLDHFDRFPPLDKFAVVVWVEGKGQQFDFGGSWCQQVAELFKLRDRAVHSRVTIHSGKPSATGPGRDMNFTETDRSMTPQLKIPKSPLLLRHQHATRVLQVVDGFTNHIVCDLCGLPTDAATEILCDVMVIEEKRAVISMADYQRAILKKGIQELGLHLPFFSKKIMTIESEPNIGQVIV